MSEAELMGWSVLGAVLFFAGLLAIVYKHSNPAPTDYKMLWSFGYVGLVFSALGAFLIFTA